MSSHNDNFNFGWASLLKRMSPAPLLPVLNFIFNNTTQYKFPIEYSLLAFAVYEVVVICYYICRLHSELQDFHKQACSLRTELAATEQRHSALADTFKCKSNLLERTAKSYFELTLLARELIFTGTKKDRQAKFDLYCKLKGVSPNNE